MGDMADFTNDNIWTEVEHAEEFCNEPLSVQYEEGLIDEAGAPVASFNSKKPGGPGPCPICKGTTSLREGKFGKFYGCNGFPTCKGSRNYC